MSNIGTLLRQLRKDKNLSYREASELSGLSHSYIRYIEIGKRPGTDTPISPTPDTLKALAKAYEHDYDDLLKAAGYLDDNKEEKSDNEKQKVNVAFHDFENLTEEEIEYLETQLEIYRRIKKRNNK
ncbi:helix-turn-helix domain-containing protein [Cytobacillus sp.]|uniref:helix-turn-helix domain-containing protein n=1 Tax=Cytobacillus sp. TaxID=2675269 RepID=UPI00351558D5